MESRKTSTLFFGVSLFSDFKGGKRMQQSFSVRGSFVGWDPFTKTAFINIRNQFDWHKEQPFLDQSNLSE
jgi:hypothetical protein